MGTAATTSLVGHWIGGRSVASNAERTGPIWDPATGELTGRVAFADEAQVDDAVRVAAEAAREWGAASLSRRTEVLFRFRELLVRDREKIARCITAQHGKVLSDAAGEVARGIENVEFACGLAHHLKGGYSEQVSRDVDTYSIRQPLGVVAGITPFNFPAMVPLWMIANALACGNSFILKPSEKDPGPSLLMAALLEEAGLPAGVFNVVQGDSQAVQQLIDHPSVAALSFVGSTPVARSIYASAAANGKRCQALGGAKNHMVVVADADLDRAADAAVSAAFGSAGERCMAISVVVAIDSIADALVAAIAERATNLRIGPGLDPASEMGPLVTAEHRARVAGYAAGAPGEGAEVVVDGGARPFSGGGFFLGASVLDRVHPGMRCYDDEIFGPVLSVVRAASLDEALAIVNANPYGNGAAIFTRDGHAARRFQVEVQCGMVGVNVPIPVPAASYSFGGWKASLFGATHIYGPEGISFYTRTKVVTSRWPESSPSAIDLSFPQLR